jgi:hypothetical protein
MTDPLLPYSRPYWPATVSQLTHFSNWLTLRLAVISHQLPALLIAVSRLSRKCSCSSLYSLGTNPIENTFSNRARVRVTLRPAVYLQSAKPLEIHSQKFFQLNICGHSPYVTSPLTRGWACRLQLLLALASAIILRSESHETHDHILLSQIRD